MFEIFLSNNLIVPSSWNKLTFQFPISKYLWFSLFHSYLGKISSFKEDFKKLVWTTILFKNESQQLHRGLFSRLQGFNFPNKKMSALCDIGHSPLGFFYSLPWLSFAARLWRRWFRNIDPQFDGRKAQHSYRNGPVKCVIPSRYPATWMTISHTQELHFFWLSIYLEK